MADELGLEKLAPQRGWEALKAIGWSIQKPRPRNPKAASAEEAEAHPGVPVEAFATDERRLGLKPILRWV
jgi:hypothetical protein